MRAGLFDVGDAELYYELRGSGPALLLISGAGGDAGCYSAMAEELRDAFTVINDDRRGKSRSTGRDGTPMTREQQASDARALIDGLGGGRALS
ncbi:alpha/beta fold hydrolase [Streptomyces sp. NPDC048192]|uniref:alpha/beta fold hydrolase n=1 Tax=Streptomyces sp. NPDC048192 TaxID=3365510 RepID=UPI00371CAD72